MSVAAVFEGAEAVAGVAAGCVGELCGEVFRCFSPAVCEDVQDVLVGGHDEGFEGVSAGVRHFVCVTNGEVLLNG